MYHAKSRSQRSSPTSPFGPAPRRQRDSAQKESSLSSTADISGVSSLLPDCLEQRNSELEHLSQAVSKATSLVLTKLQHLRNRSGDVSEEGSASPVPSLRPHRREENRPHFLPSPRMQRGHTRCGSLYSTAPLTLDFPLPEVSGTADLNDLEEQ